MAAAQDSLGVRLVSGNHPANLPLGLLRGELGPPAPLSLVRYESYIWTIYRKTAFYLFILLLKKLFKKYFC